MRVDDRYANNNPAVQAGKSPGAQEIERSLEVRNAETRWGLASDRVELSELTGGLARILSVSARDRAARVEQLRQEYAAGRYQVDVEALSRKIAAEIRATAAQPPLKRT